MAIDWGDILGGAIGQIGAGLADDNYATNIPPVYYPNPSPAPIAGRPAVGVAAPHCKRRRRRRLLTESDFNDLMRIATLPNKQNVAVALAKAVGRR